MPKQQTTLVKDLDELARATPMFRQFAAAKRAHPDALLLFRMGDFYETFGEDAEIAARELELTLTSRDAGKGKRVPMCGVPHHAVQRYLAQLVRKGYRCAICDQMEDPKLAKGIVKRAVTRVVTPGTLLEDEMLEAGAHNFLVAVTLVSGAWGIAVVEVSTGDFLVTQIDAEERGMESLVEEISRLMPAEIVVSGALAQDEALCAELRDKGEARVTAWEETSPAWQSAVELLSEHFGVASLEGFGCADLPAAVEAAALALRYLRANELPALQHLRQLITYSTGTHMVIDAATRRNLELVEGLRPGDASRTLLSLVDDTRTPMGARLCRQWLLRPLLDEQAIAERLDAVAELVRNATLAGEAEPRLRVIRDLERLMARTAAGTATPRDLRALAVSCGPLAGLKAALSAGEAARLQHLGGQIDPLDDLIQLVETALVEDPPAQPSEGGLFRDGYSGELDELRQASAGGKQWIAALQAQEREATGIKSLKVGFNQVFGYYIEVSKPNLSLVPESYIRKQTMTNAERFITPELKEKEALVLGAEEKIADLEYRLFCELRSQVAEACGRVFQSARAVAELDVLAGLARLAIRNGYVRPEVDRSPRLEIRAGRHPVVEEMLGASQFVPNDVRLDTEKDQLLIVTGPNMAGKSTYLRQVALIVLLAQMGSFVPAQEARIGLVDRIFTRVGASDDLATGQSTFMVEMTESANILHNATERSLVVLDEIGRGTSTFDGLSIAWAVAEYLVNQVGAKTMFATHYHHLNELEQVLPRVRNVRVAVREEGEDVTFLYRIVDGGADRSYGIQVARLAGLPVEVIERAKEVLHSLEAEDLGSQVAPTERGVRQVAPPVQLQLFEAAPHPVVEKLKELDLDQMTPLQAMTRLGELQQEAQGEGEGTANQGTTAE